MISHANALDRKIRESNLEEIYERLRTTRIDQNFAEVLAEFGSEIANNTFFEPYIREIEEKEKTYRNTPDINLVIQQASFNAQLKQKLNQEMLTRKERKSEYFSVWLILRFNELYDISLHERVRAELIAKNDLRDLADFDTGVIAISNILKGNSNADLADYYLPHAHRVISGIIQFFDKQCSTSNQNQHIQEKTPSHSKNTSVKYKREVTITFGNDSIELSSVDTKSPPIKKYDPKKRQDNLRFKLLALLCNHHPHELSKKQLVEECKKKYAQINRARRGINEKMNDKLRCNDLIKRDRTTGRMALNDKYDIILNKK